MNQVILTQLSSRACTISGNIGSGMEEFSDEDNSWGSCIANSCISGYHIENQTCLNNIKACSVDNGSGTQIWNGSGYNGCIANLCEGSFHIENNQCLSNTRACSSALITEGTQTWNQSLNNYNSCIPSQCISEYHITNMVYCMTMMKRFN